MKKGLSWKILLLMGSIPFIFPFINFAYERMTASSWTLGEWLILYSFVYWPTYLIGLVLLAISIYKMKK